MLTILACNNDFLFIRCRECNMATIPGGCSQCNDIGITKVKIADVHQEMIRRSDNCVKI